ncbi:MAG: c-type cytochrome [Gammaproteobacteria bacterium]|nr:c-type cytochrome [Gammaproteobacteria bacterium]
MKSCAITLLMGLVLLLQPLFLPAATPLLPGIAEREAERALGLKPDPAKGRELYRICIVCHSPEGWGSENGYYPQIAGQLYGVIIKQLADIRAGNRDNPTMFPFSMPGTLGGAQEMADVAAYIAALPMSPHNGRGPGHDLVLGERIYRDECAECHGEWGEGSAGDRIPLLRGQHYYYLKRQFRWIRNGKRRNADEKMVKQAQHFSGREISAVMDYISRIEPEPGRVVGPDWTNPDFPNYARHSMPGLMQHRLRRRPEVRPR